MKQILAGVCACFIFGLSLSSPSYSAENGFRAAGSVHSDISPPLGLIPPSPRSLIHKLIPLHHLPVRSSPWARDPSLQSTFSAQSSPPVLLGFEGVGLGFSGPAGTFNVNSAPPDTNGDAGPNHYVQMVNTDFAIFDKLGNAIYGPVPSNTLWRGFGGGCETNNDGDGSVHYDQLAGRWIITQFSVNTQPYLQCVAVSTSGDPLGSYARYSFQYANFPDYPKFAIWPDAYYFTFNLFNGNNFVGSEVCAYDRAAMLRGTAATQQCFQLASIYGGLLASRVLGYDAPPAGAPNFIMNFGLNSLNLWKFHVDWENPSATSLTGPRNILVPPFNAACGGGACIAQLGTTQSLDSLGDRLMHQLVYRNFGDHDALVLNHSVASGSSTGVRWYELRNLNSTPLVYQAGTYAPDSSSRWMGSVAIDRAGNIGLGYSISSSAMNPGIRFTGHSTTDPLGVMGQGEGVIFSGTGSQFPSLERWGDYSSMSVDPTDDCTFWYTNEYLANNGAFNWQTRVGSFKLPGCGAPDFGVLGTPNSAAIQSGLTVQYTVSVAPLSGFSQNIGLSVSGLPSGATASFSPSLTSTSSTLTVATSANTPGGTSTLTITGIFGTLKHSTTVRLAIVHPDFSLSVSPGAATVVRGRSASFAIAANPSSGFSGAISLKVSGLPTGATAVFSPSNTTSSSTLTVTTTSNTVLGSFPLTITGSSGALSHSVTATLNVGRTGDLSLN